MILEASAPIATTRQSNVPELGQEPTHGVCDCQVDAVPRLALCGMDVSGEAEAITDTVCVVCFELFVRRVPCRHCGARS